MEDKNWHISAKKEKSATAADSRKTYEWHAKTSKEYEEQESKAIRELWERWEAEEKEELDWLSALFDIVVCWGEVMRPIEEGSEHVDKEERMKAFEGILGWLRDTLTHTTHCGTQTSSSQSSSPGWYGEKFTDKARTIWRHQPAHTSLVRRSLSLTLILIYANI